MREIREREKVELREERRKESAAEYYKIIEIFTSKTHGVYKKKNILAATTTFPRLIANA